MTRLKVMTIVGTRPELIKLSRVIAELDRCTDHVLVHTDQNYDNRLNRIFFDELDIRNADYYLDAAGRTSSETIANVILKIDPVLSEVRPDAVLLYGDTNSCMAAIAAKKHKIPVFHMEAGNRCFDERVPEEINRRIIDHISDINMPLTEHARRYLIAEGIRPETIIKIGSCIHEVLEFYEPKINQSLILQDVGLISQGYFVVSAHREENVDKPETLRSLIESLNELVNEYNLPIIFSTHPRTRNRLDELQFGELDPKIKFMEPMGFLDYVHLQKNAKCVISDSGTIAEEASLLNLPAVTIRQAHERPEGVDEGTLIISEIIPEQLLESVAVILKQHKNNSRTTKIVSDYLGGPVSIKVTRIILSYTNYVKRTVWFNE
jgi:UDP-N-acetylglucosamine 2-epimerase